MHRLLVVISKICKVKPVFWFSIILWIVVTQRFLHEIVRKSKSKFPLRKNSCTEKLATTIIQCLQYSSLRGTNPDRLRLGNKRGTEFSYLGPLMAGKGTWSLQLAYKQNKITISVSTDSSLLPQFWISGNSLFNSPSVVIFPGTILVFIKVSSYRLQIAGQSQLSGHFDADQS